MIPPNSHAFHNIPYVMMQLESNLTLSVQSKSSTYDRLHQNNLSTRELQKKQEIFAAQIEEIFLRTKTDFEKIVETEKTKFNHFEEKLTVLLDRDVQETIFQDFALFHQSFEQRMSALDSWSAAQEVILDTKIRAIQSQASQNASGRTLAQMQSKLLHMQETIANNQNAITLDKEKFLNLCHNFCEEMETFLSKRKEHSHTALKFSCDAATETPSQDPAEITTFCASPAPLANASIEKTSQETSEIALGSALPPERDLSPAEIKEILHTTLIPSIDLQKAEMQFKDLFESAFLGKELSKTKLQLLQASRMFFSTLTPEQGEDCIIARKVFSDHSMNRELAERALIGCLILPSTESEYELYQCEGPSCKTMNKSHEQIKTEIQKSTIRNFRKLYMTQADQGKQLLNPNDNPKTLPLDDYFKKNFTLLVNRKTQIGIPIKPQ